MTTPEFTFDDLKEMLVHHGGVPASAVPRDPSLSLEALGLSSIAMLAIQLDLVQRYGIQLAEEDLPHLATVGSFLSFVNERKEQPPAG